MNRLRIFQLFQCVAELVGAGGGFVAAADAAQFGDYVVDSLACDEAADALQVAVAATEERDLLDDVVVVGRHVDEHRTGALGGVLYVFHIFLLVGLWPQN